MKLYASCALSKACPAWLICCGLVAAALAGVANVFIIAKIGALVSPDVSGLHRTLLQFLGLLIFMATLRIAADIILTRLSLEITKAVRLMVCHEIMEAPVRNIEQIGAAKLHTSLGSDVTSISNALIAFPQFLLQLAIVASCLSYIAFQSVLLFSCFLAFLLFGLLAHHLIGRSGSAHFWRGRPKQDVVSQCIEYIINGVKELKLNLRRAEEMRERLAMATEGAKSDLQKGIITYSIAGTTANFLYFLMIGTCILIGAYFAKLPPEKLLGFSLVGLFMKASVEEIMMTFSTFAQANIAAGAVNNLGFSLSREREIPVKRQEFCCEQPPILRLYGVRFSYGDGEASSGQFALGPISFSVASGEIVMISGGNGSGKTTLAKVVGGLYRPQSGSIFLNSIEIGDESRDWYRSHFSAVFSDGCIFPEISSQVSEERATNLVSTFGLQDVVRVESGRFEFDGLSAGQRKRLALIQLLLENRPICLFDEWAAEQDSSFRKRFYNEWLPALKEQGKLILVISHDEAFFNVADRVLSFDRGSLIDEAAASASYGSGFKIEPAALSPA